MEDIDKYVRGGFLKIIAKPNSRKTEIIEWDADRQALRVDVHAHPEDNEANIEVIKFFSKLLKKKVSIKSGLRSKVKLLKIS